MKWFLTLALVLAAGCVVDPYSQLETATPTLSAAQQADLDKRAKPASEFGLDLRPNTGGVSFSGAINQVVAPRTVTLPLLKIPTEKGERYRLPVVVGSINGKTGVRIMLDSGSNGHLLGYSLARSLGVPALAGVQPVRGMGIGGTVDNRLAMIASLQFGDLEIQKQFALIGPDAQALQMTRMFWGNAHVMIGGVSAWRNLSYLSIDNLKGTATFSASEPYVPDPTLKTVAAVSLRWMNDLPCVEAQIDGKATGLCVLDTGGDYGMLVPRRLAGGLGYWQPGKEKIAMSRGVAGAALDATYDIRAVQIGPAVFTQVPARTNVVGPEPAGALPLIGNVVLRRHRVTFDFRTGMLWLER